MPILSPAELLSWLGQNQFLTTPQTEEIQPLLISFPDSQALARELIRRDWLTPYQANQIFQGNQDQLILGNYRLRERIGEGAMGQVFKAWNLRTLRVVAVKTLHKELVKSPKVMDRFRREVETAAQLEHPNIAHVRDADEANGKPYMVMDFIEGTDLSQRVKKSGPLPIAEAVEYVRQAALGLQHAFERGIVHRDIKPANLILTTVKVNNDPMPLVKILDFGLARFDSENDDDNRLTQLGRLLGTIDYIAPEQAQDARSADIRADIYSLGCTLYCLLTGQAPFQGDSMVEKLSPRVTGEPPRVCDLRPEVPAPLEQVLQKMMARRPDHRYQTPLEVAHALASVTGEGSSPVPIAMALPISAPANSEVALALPVGPAAASIPLAQPVAAPGETTAATLELPPDMVAPTPSQDPAFLGMSATGRDPATGKAPAKRKPGASVATKIIVAVVGAAFAVAMVACFICLLSWLLSSPKKKGSIVILPDTKFANPKNQAKPGLNRVLVFIKRVDFAGPVSVTLRNLPDGITPTPTTIPANSDKIDLVFVVSYLTPPQQARIRLFVEYEPDGISAELPMTLTIIEDPTGKKK